MMISSKGPESSIFETLHRKASKANVGPHDELIAVTSPECPGYALTVTLFTKHLLKIEAMQTFL